MYAFIMHSKWSRIDIYFFSFLWPVEHFQKSDEFYQLSVIIMIIFKLERLCLHVVLASPFFRRMEEAFHLIRIEVALHLKLSEVFE